MEEMNEKIAAEALQIVEHALSLIQSEYFDDSIEFLKQAIVLYEQIDKKAEVEALYKKISDVHVMKESAFIERERENEKGLNMTHFEETSDVSFTEIGIPNRVDTNIVETEEDDISNLGLQKRIKEQDEQEIRKCIDILVKNAEKLGREYDIEFKKAIKEGNLEIQSQYPEIIDMYAQARESALNKGWKDEAQIYSTQIKKYNELFEREQQVRQIEAEKAQETKKFEEMLKVKQVKSDKKELEEDDKTITKKKFEELKEQETRQKVNALVKNAEKMGRAYDVEFKKAIKEGNLEIQSRYPEIIDMYTQARDIAMSNGWNDEALIHSTQIKKYNELFEREQQVRNLEAAKVQETKKFEEMLKVKQVKSDKKELEEDDKTITKKKFEELKEQETRQNINTLVKNAEKMGRAYDVEFKKAIKEGNLEIQSRYPEIIDMYTQARDIAMSNGWNDEALMNSTQIRKYTELFEKEQKIRRLEEKKREEQKEFEEVMNKRTESASEIERMTNLDESQTEEEQFERLIDSVVDQAEKKAREYELAIKKGQFERKCPYLEISDKYQDLYEQVYRKGWKDEAVIYLNQVKIYKNKFEKDQQLRKLELEKQNKQKEFEESLKRKEESGSSILKIQELEKVSESEIQLNKAMNLITEAESSVRSYELSIKKEILLIESPYEEAILKYEQAYKLFKTIGWVAEADRLRTTINFYKDKKAKDDKLRKLEEEKLSGEKEKDQLKPMKRQPELRELEVVKIEEEKFKKEKEADFIFKLIQEAENQSKTYERQLKKGILNVECPYENIIAKYKKAQFEFEKIGWSEQANQINDSIRYYDEKLANDNKLRELEREKQIKEEKVIQKKKIQAKLAREAEAELLKQKAQALEIKKKKSQEYESKKEQAFSLMDRAKKEFKLDHFDVSIKFYKESEKIFKEINWSEGIKMVSESIDLIRKKEEKIEAEAKRLIQKEEEERISEIALKEEISKAEDLKRVQEEQKRREFEEIQKQKEQERLISEEAYQLLEKGTELKDDKKFDEAYEKYIMARDLFDKLEWNHEVSRINNDLLFILKKEMKQVEKIKAFEQKKIEEEKELEALLQEAEVRRVEVEKAKKEEKKLKREKYIQDELDKASSVIKDLRYNEAIPILKKLMTKVKKMEKKEVIRQIENQLETIQNATQVPLITLSDLKENENFERVKIAYEALDNANLSLLKDLKMRAISELEEAKYNLGKTLIGTSYIPSIEEKIISLKGEITTDETLPMESYPEESKAAQKEDDLMEQIKERRIKRKKKIQDLLDDLKK